MTKPSAKIILDSISSAGYRLTTMEVVFHRWVLAEFNTHRAFSRNSASSRAIPTEKLIERVLTDPAMPLEWGSNKPGMQAGPNLPWDHEKACESTWLFARNNAVLHAGNLHEMGVHKQIVNRLLEPFLWHTAIVSSTEWENFFAQRASPKCENCKSKGHTIYVKQGYAAQSPCFNCNGSGFTKSLAAPEITAVADAMRIALNESKPVERKFHMPYMIGTWGEMDSKLIEECKQISTAFCANKGTYGHDGKGITEDAAFRIFNNLKNATPPHMSPFEHVAEAQEPEMIHYQKITSSGGGTMALPTPGNFTGWKQYRHEVFGK